MVMKKNICSFGIIVLLFLNACSPQIPENAALQKEKITISPDYSNLIIPYNIAPLNFSIHTEADEYRTVIYSTKGEKLIVSSKKVQFNQKDWEKLLSENKGDTVFIDIYLKKEGKWLKYPTMKNTIAEEEIDSYISYRLLEPSYVTYESMTINQRNLSNFDEKVIYSNMFLSSGDNAQCINCHNYQNYNKNGNMQFHVRQNLGGTIIINNNKAQKVNLKTDYTISGGVYPAWHPTKNMIVYSVNNTGQNFHTKDKQKVEVTDSESYLILYDIDKNEVREIVNQPDQMETFPAWSTDGNFLYYVSATYPEGLNDTDNNITVKYEEVQYNLYRKAFNPETLEFAYTDTIYEASKYNKSATFPRESPDRRYLLFTLGNFGNFHIWHKSSDLCLFDLKTRELREMNEINSPDVESYHSWSSNGHWIIFSSRRDDGSYTRSYISYFKNGKASKPFILPQKDPGFYTGFFKSYNIPEFMVEPIQISRKELIETIKGEPLNALYLNTKNKTQLKAKEEGTENFYE